jgi:hypothetical protein
VGICAEYLHNHEHWSGIGFGTHSCGEIPQNHPFLLSIRTLTSTERVRYILVLVEIELIPRVHIWVWNQVIKCVGISVEKEEL